MRKVIRVLLGLLAVATVLGMAACDMAITKTDATGTTALTEATVFASIGGLVVGPDGKPLSGVVISYQTGEASRAIGTYTTTANGMFELNGFISGYHTVFIGNGVSSTQETISFLVPELAELRDDSAIVVYDYEMGTTMPAESIIEQYEGNYFVNITLSEGYDKFVLYPCTASISGTAMLRTTLQNQEGTGEAVVAPAGTVIVADFSAWNADYPLLYRGTVGAAGAFTISNVPAVSDTIASSGPIYLYAVTGDELEGEAANKSNTDSISDGVLEPGMTRSFPDTPFYFTVGYAPRIVTFSPLPTTLDGLGVSGTETGVTFSPGTALAPTPIVLTFDEAMNTAKGTATVVDTASGGKTYTVSAGWTGTTVLTLTPSLMFGYGQTIKVTLTGYESAAEVAYVPPAAGLLFAVSPAFAKVSDNMTFSTTGTQQFPVGGNLTATFNYDLGFVDLAATDIYTYSGTLTSFLLETRIDAAVGIAGKVLTVNPTADLEPNTDYILYYSVKTAMLEGTQDLAGNSETTGLKFRTAPDNTALTAPTTNWLAQDSVAKIAADGTSKYEFGDTLVYVTIQKVANADSYSYRYRESSADDWIVIPNPVVSTTEDATYFYATLDLSPAGAPTIIEVTPEATRQVQVLAVKSVDGDAVLASNIVDVVDTTAPTSVSTSVLSGFSNPNPVGGDSVVKTITIYFTNSEPMTTRLVADFSWSATPALTTISRVRKDTDNTAMYVDLVLAPTASVNATLSVALYDAASNAYDNDTGLIGTQPFAMVITP